MLDSIKEALSYYKNFKLSKLTSKEYKHLLWLLFWPGFSLMFTFVEKIFTPVKWHVMQCELDEIIPFNEWFYIPYILWFIYVAGSLIYTLLYDKEAFSNLMRFIAITYSVAIIVFLVYPNCQLLRPFSLPDGNFMARLVGHFYRMDTNTNVFPSIHVIGSIASLYGLWNAKRLNKWRFRIPFIILTVLISISTVFMKQHSALDVAGGVVVCLVIYGLLMTANRISIKSRIRMKPSRRSFEDSRLI